MFKFILRKVVKKAIPLLVTGIIKALTSLAKKSTNTIDDRFVIMFEYNRKAIENWLIKNIKKYIK